MNIFIEQNGLQTFLKPWLNKLDLICLKLVCKSFKKIIDQYLPPTKSYESCKWVVRLAVEKGYWKLADDYLKWMKYHVPSKEVFDKKRDFLLYPVYRKEDLERYITIFRTLCPNQISDFDFDFVVETGNPIVIGAMINHPTSAIYVISDLKKVWKRAMEQQNVELVKYLWIDRKLSVAAAHQIDLGNCTNLEIAKLATSESAKNIRKGRCSLEVSQYIMETWKPSASWIIYEHLKHGQLEKLDFYRKNHYEKLVEELQTTLNEEAILFFFDDGFYISGEQFMHFVKNRFNRAIKKFLEQHDRTLVLPLEDYREISKIDPLLFRFDSRKSYVLRTV